MMTFVPPSAPPPELIVACWKEIDEAGYYRTSAEIKFDIRQDAITMEVSSRIVPTKPSAEIPCPSQVIEAEQGLAIVKGSQNYKCRTLKGRRVKSDGGMIKLSEEAEDLYCVQFQRVKSFKEVFDTHIWLAPVTDFKVSFDYQRLVHRCDIKDLSRVVDLKRDNTKSNRLEFVYPIASFSGQSFTWCVGWLR